VTDGGTHLSEDERHALAELPASLLAGNDRGAHLRDCAACADDVERIRALVTAARDAARDAPLPDDLWPAIRSRIEARKVVAMSGAPMSSTGSLRPRPVARVGALVTFGALTAAALMLGVIDNRRPPANGPADPGAQRSAAVTATTVADSTRAYQQEAQQLLDRLELQRALLRPEAARALDDDLRTIDAAIAELQDAIAHDPENPALRQLLASSYRQKVELLRRAGNAG